MRRYNAVVTLRHIIPFLTTIALLAISSGCNRAPENKVAVREGVMEHLSKNTGLDLKSMDIDVGNVTFQGNQATAAVSFKPKGSSDGGMSMNYTLERREGKWVVQQKAGGGAGHGPAIPGPTQPVPPAAGGDLPPGHPPVTDQVPPPKAK